MDDEPTPPATASARPPNARSLAAGPSTSKPVRPNKRPLPFKKKFTGPPPQRFRKGEKSGKVSYEKEDSPLVKHTYPRESFFQILVTNQAIPFLCRIVFTSISTRDMRMAQNMTLPLLKYVTCLAYLNRIIQCGIKYGYSISNQTIGVTDLNNALEGLQLPAVLCRYIESIGMVKMASGASVVPWFVSDRHGFFDEQLGQIDPAVFLAEGNRPPIHNYWSVDYEWITEWNQATTRPARLGMHFRKIRWSEPEGSVEMAVTPIPYNGRVMPTAPQSMPDVDAQVGAIFDYRRFETVRLWPAQTAVICQQIMNGTEIVPVSFWGMIVTASFTSDGSTRD